MRTRFLSLAFLALVLPGCSSDDPKEPTVLRIMTYNIWGGGANEDKSVDETVAVIRAADADIVGLQETRLESDPCTAESCPATGSSVAKEIAEALDFYYYDQTDENPALWANAVISRYPILGASGHDLGVEIEIGEKTVIAWNIHLTDFPYQPYQLLDIEYGDAPFLDTAEEAIEAAQKARGPALDLLFEDMNATPAADAEFVFGDFNEPSHRDWVKAAVDAGLQPLVVKFPSALRIEKAGFVDALRAVHKDVAKKPAFTWTPTSDPNYPYDHHDRIDFVLAKSENLEVVDAQVVGEKKSPADIVVTPWPSDHRSIVAEISF
jgi:exodeoxyribonuclease III